jgi:hypothetical protein
VAECIAGAGKDPRAFALGRLGLEAELRSVDPWSIAPQEAARRLIAGSFRADAFRLRERWAVELPGPGPWAAESPYAAPISAGAPPTAWLEPGIHRLVGGGGELAVSVPEGGGEALLVPLPDQGAGARRAPLDQGARRPSAASLALLAGRAR